VADETHVQIPIEALVVTLKQRIDRDLRERVARLGIYLVQKIKIAYSEVIKVNRGEGGALGGLLSEVEYTRQFIELHLGTTPAGAYLRNMEYGERGTQGGTGTMQRAKAPPLKNIYDWIRAAGLSTPAYYVLRAEAHAKMKVKSDKPWYSDNAQILYAYDIAQKRKRLGRPALRMIDRVLQQQSTTIENYLAGNA
jgi:hypothetical protein